MANETSTAGVVFVDGETDQDVDPISLGQLSGARLSYETADGTTEVVEFDE